MAFRLDNKWMCLAFGFSLTISVPDFLLGTFLASSILPSSSSARPKETCPPSFVPPSSFGLTLSPLLLLFWGFLFFPWPQGRQYWPLLILLWVRPAFLPCAPPEKTLLGAFPLVLLREIGSLWGIGLSSFTSSQYVHELMHLDFPFWT